MTANPSIANPSLIPDAEQTVSESGKPKLQTLLDRMEEVLRKALGTMSRQSRILSVGFEPYTRLLRRHETF